MISINLQTKIKAFIDEIGTACFLYTTDSILIPTASVYSPLHSQYVKQLNNRTGIVSSGLHCIRHW